MPKGYWIVHTDIRDVEAYAAYARANSVPMERHGARFLVLSDAGEAHEGTARRRSVVIEFPSLAAARACHADPDYRAAMALRKGAAEFDLVIVEGLDD